MGEALIGSPNRNQRAIRRARALERADAREERGWTGQLAELDRRLGKGVGAKRERERIELDRTVAQAMAGAKLAVEIDRHRSKLQANTGALRLSITVPGRVDTISIVSGVKGARP